MQVLKRIVLPALVMVGSSALFASPASAQLFGPNDSNVYTVALLGAGNISSDGSGNVAEWPSVEQYDPTGGAITATGSYSFTGLDSQGHTQTMTLSGTGKASAGYGVLHTYATGTVTNPYYNASNPKYFTGLTNNGKVNPAGSPQYLSVSAQAVFNDTIAVSSPSDPIIGYRYLFHVDGNITNAGNSFAFLAFSAGGNSTVFETQQEGSNSADWATPEWTSVTGNIIHIGGTFGSDFTVDAANTPEGQDVSGTSDFYNTLTLTGIQLLDASGNPVNGAIYETASGTHYNIQGATYGIVSVPEPGTLALVVGLGLSGASCFLKRRRVRS